jgi:hypothetical protein
MFASRIAFLSRYLKSKKKPGLKGGKMRKFPTELPDAIRTGLRKWTREVLMPQLYPKEAGFSMTGSALLPDTTIEQLPMCGERVDTVLKLQRRARWFLMANHGPELLQELQRIFQEYDKQFRPPGPRLRKFRCNGVAQVGERGRKVFPFVIYGNRSLGTRGETMIRARSF